MKLNGSLLLLLFLCSTESLVNAQTLAPSPSLSEVAAVATIEENSSLNECDEGERTLDAALDQVVLELKSLREDKKGAEEAYKFVSANHEHLLNVYFDQGDNFNRLRMDPKATMDVTLKNPDGSDVTISMNKDEVWALVKSYLSDEKLFLANIEIYQSRIERALERLTGLQSMYRSFRISCGRPVD